MNTETNVPAPEWAVKCAEEVQDAWWDFASTGDIAAIIAGHTAAVSELVEYVRHAPTCLADNGRECSCGLSELLSRFDQANKKGDDL